MPASQRLRWNEVLYGKCLLSQCLEHYKFFRVAAVLENEKINKKLRAKTQFCMAIFLSPWFQGYWNRAFTGNRVEPNLKNYVCIFCVFLSSGTSLQSQIWSRLWIFFFRSFFDSLTLLSIKNKDTDEFTFWTWKAV